MAASCQVLTSGSPQSPLFDFSALPFLCTHFPALSPSVQTLEELLSPVRPRPSTDEDPPDFQACHLTSGLGHKFFFPLLFSKHGDPSPRHLSFSLLMFFLGAQIVTLATFSFSVPLGACWSINQITLLLLACFSLLAVPPAGYPVRRLRSLPQELHSGSLPALCRYVLFPGLKSLPSASPWALCRLSLSCGQLHRDPAQMSPLEGARFASPGWVSHR